MRSTALFLLAAALGATGSLAAATAVTERTGEEIVKAQCSACHESGRYGAPRIDDRAAWIARMKNGLDAAVRSAMKGHGKMPARGGLADLSDSELRAAVVYMFNPAGVRGTPPRAENAPPPGTQAATVDGIRIHLLANIERYMPYAKSAEEMICIQLREYLRPVIREIGKTEFSDKLRLEPGINVMDITDLSDGLKSLVIRSVIETVHRKLRKTVVIVPEAWKFIPEGRSTPER